MIRATKIADLVAEIGKSALRGDARYWDLCRTHGDTSAEVLGHLQACVEYQRSKASRDRVLLATDEGTHARPVTQRVYREADGTRTLVRRHGEAQLPPTTLAAEVKIADLPTDGRWRSIRGVSS